MSLFQRLWGMLSGSASTPATDATQPVSDDDRGAATCIAEANAAGVDETPPWWRDLSAASETAAAVPVDQALYDALARTLDDPNLELPRMPRIADQALLKLRDAEVDYRALAEILQQDATLAAQVLRVANSVRYRGFAEIRSLDLAFARIGQRALRTIVLSSTMQGLSIRTGGATRSLGEELWRASRAHAVICGELARHIGLPEDDCTLLGLLHDLGMLGVLRTCHEHAQHHNTAVTRELFDRLAAEWHEHLGLRLAEAWGLPDPLPQLIGNHHRDPAPGDPHARERNLLLVADGIAGLLGFTPRRPADLLALPAAGALGLRQDVGTHAWLLELPARVTERIDSF